jgi:hypothetical protein
VPTIALQDVAMKRAGPSRDWYRSFWGDESAKKNRCVTGAEKNSDAGFDPEEAVRAEDVLGDLVCTSTTQSAGSSAIPRSHSVHTRRTRQYSAHMLFPLTFVPRFPCA